MDLVVEQWEVMVESMVVIMGKHRIVLKVVMVVTMVVVVVDLVVKE